MSRLVSQSELHLLPARFATAAEQLDESGLEDLAAPPGLGVRPRAKCPQTRSAAQAATKLGLDPTVVASALQSGVPMDQLEAVSQLVRDKPTRLEDVPRKAAAGKNALSESEDEPADLLEDPALAEGMDPVAAALTQLTKIVGKLSTGGKKKEPTLEDLLEGAGSASSSAADGSLSFSSRRHAAALRALKKALVNS